MKVLSGHTSPDTAYVVEDYPYGFRLRCQMRYWLETKRGHGQRLVSQTSNPKRPGLVWNKPKASTYTIVLAMYLDAAGHVQTASVDYPRDEDAITTFETTYAEALTGAYEQDALRFLRASNRVSKRLTWTICTDSGGAVTHDEKCSGNCGKQTIQQQSQAIETMIRQEMWKDTHAAIEQPTV